MSEVSSVAAPVTAPIAQVATPPVEVKAEAAPVAAPAAPESSEKGAGIAQATPTDSQAKKLYMTA